MNLVDRARELIAFLQSCVLCGESLNVEDLRKISDWMKDSRAPVENPSTPERCKHGILSPWECKDCLYEAAP